MADLIQRLRQRAKTSTDPLLAMLAREAASKIEALTSQVAVMGVALEPFDDFADNVDDVGWASDVHKESISYWFGPSDFRKARLAAAKEPS